MNTNETWRTIPSLNFAEASSLGRIRVIPYEAPLPNGGVRTYGGTPSYGQWDGSRFIHRLRGKTYKVARLVCEAFNGPAEQGQVCMHKDEDSRNNVPDNLAWGSQKENLNAPGFIEYCRTRTGDNSPVRKGTGSKS